jgi:Ca2+-binding RTX toxin-like protein
MDATGFVAAKPPLADDFMSGDRGNDTIYGGQGADVFNTFGDAGLDRVMDFNSTEGDRVHFEAATTYVLRYEGGDTIIDIGGRQPDDPGGCEPVIAGDWLA